jgi:hypothetical protein
VIHCPLLQHKFVTHFWSAPHCALLEHGTMSEQFDGIMLTSVHPTAVPSVVARQMHVDAESQKKLGLHISGRVPPGHVICAGGGAQTEEVDVVVVVVVVVATTWSSVMVVRVLMTRVCVTMAVTVGTYVMVDVLVMGTVGREVIVEVLQPGVVSMQEHSVLTKDAACFWREVKMGASLSSLLVRFFKTAAGHAVVVVVSVCISVTVVGVGVLVCRSEHSFTCDR